MLGENKNLKDISRDSIKDTSSTPISKGASTSLVSYWRDSLGSYGKTDKLITALYMVTDTMEKEEPIRLKLRTLGTDILLDINSSSRTFLTTFIEKISAILSFLNIAFDVGMISEMNSNILKKEFIELKKSIDEFIKQKNLFFEDFMINPPRYREEEKELFETEGGNFLEGFVRNTLSNYEKKNSNMSFNKNLGKGQNLSTRIGVQKGGTLLKALGRVEANHNGLLKEERRESIRKIIKDKPEGMSIKDITDNLQKFDKKIGEKTLQRELISMVSDGVLKKVGEKRWSKYLLN